MWLVERVARRAGLAVAIYLAAERAWRAFELVAAERNRLAVGA